MTAMGSERSGGLGLSLAHSGPASLLVGAWMVGRGPVGPSSFPDLLA